MSADDCQPKMYQRNPRRFVIGIAQQCLLFVNDMTFEEFSWDRKTQLAVVKDLEIIGEAAGKLPGGIRNACSEVP